MAAMTSLNPKVHNWSNVTLENVLDYIYGNFKQNLTSLIGCRASTESVTDTHQLIG